jgi:hypothetical protein
MVARLSALLTSRTLLPRNIIFSVSGMMEELSKLKNFTSSGLEPMTFCLVA